MELRFKAADMVTGKYGLPFLITTSSPSKIHLFFTCLTLLNIETIIKSHQSQKIKGLLYD